MGRGGRGEREEDVQVPLLGRRLEPPRKRSTLFSVCPFILGNELCERLAYYGLATNLITYMTRIMGIDAAAAAISIMIFEGTAYVTPLLGAYLADSFWGRYRTILIFSSIYLVGMVLLTLTSWVPGLTPGHGEDASWAQIGALMGSLGVIALGTGGIKPNVSAFGADQFDEADPQDKAEKESFFNYFYLAINIGSLIACTVIVWVQDSVSWTLGFAMPAMAMGSAVMLFLAGSGRYRHVAPTESPMARVVKVVTAALRARLRGTNKQQQQQQQQPESRVPSAIGVTGGGYAGDAYDDGVTGGAPSALQQAPGGGHSYFSPLGRSGSAPRMNVGGNAASKSYRWLEDAITEWADSQGTHPADGGPLAPAPGVTGVTGAATGTGGVGGYTRRQVEEVKLVLRLLPIFWTTVVYWTLYGFMGTFFIAQGSLMDNAVSIPWLWGSSSSSSGRRLGDAAAPLGRGGGGHSGGGGGGGGDGGNGWFVFHIPSATMALFNTGAIILLVPLYDKVIDPLLTRLGRKLTLLRKIGWGMAVCTLAMLYAAGIEAWRLRVCRAACGAAATLPAAGPAEPSPGGGGGGGGGQERVPINILWQAPAYILVGASEVLASVGQLEFFYDQAPDVMRSCSMALQLLSTALGSYLGGGVVAAVQAASTRAGAPWLPKDLNHGHLDYFFYLTAALMAVNSALFVWVAAHYEYKAIEHKIAVIVPSVEDVAAAQQAAAAAAAGVPQPIPGAPGLLSRRLAAAGPPTGGPPPPPGGAPGTPPLPGALLPPGLPRPAAGAARWRSRGAAG